MKTLRYAVLLLALGRLLSPGSAAGAGVGLGINVGLAMPGDGQVRSTRNLINQYGPWQPGADLHGVISDPSINQVAGHIIFHGKQIGIELGGEVFLKVGKYQFGVDASHLSRDNLRASLISGTLTSATGLQRTFTTAQLSFRMDVPRIGIATPYVGVGLGGYNLKEQIQTKPSNVQKGVLIQGIAGLSARIGPATRLFTELKLNLAELDEASERDPLAIATFGLSVGIRFGG
jgi:opacity protein-like surface antigen